MLQMYNLFIVKKFFVICLTFTFNTYIFSVLKCNTMGAQFTIHTDTHYSLSKGKLLIAEPFLQDPNFMRSVILICNADTEGAFGLTLNKESEHIISDLVPELHNSNFPVYIGGPVDHHHLFVLHTRPDLLGGENIINKVYWGVEFDKLLSAINLNLLNKHEVKFFIGYSGWAENQLEAEIKEKAWLIAPATPSLIFDTNCKEMYKNSLQPLGKQFKSLALLPTSPHLN
jgi:putative transcriptional regulator